MRLGPGWARGRGTAALATILGAGLDALDAYFGKYVPQLILTAIATPLLVLVMLLQDPLSGIIVLVTLPLIPVFMILIGWATQAAQKRSWSRLQLPLGRVPRRRRRPRHPEDLRPPAPPGRSHRAPSPTSTAATP